MSDDLLRWSTRRETEILEAIEAAGGNHTAAAAALGINQSNVSRAYARVKARAAAAGYSPEHDMTHVVPDGFRVKGVSTYYNKEGKPTGQWVKSQVDRERTEQLVREAVAALTEDIRGTAPLTAPPIRQLDDLMAVYPFGDPHIGMYAWADEAGDDFDLEIAERLTLGAVDRLLSSAPAAGTAVLLLLGDVFHMNDRKNITPGHGHVLDVDSRYAKVLQVGIKTYRHAIQRALEKHRRVIVRCVEGNHDHDAVWALAFTLAAFFENEPRVEVDLSPSKFWYFQFGKVLIASTHGDTAKHEQLGPIMATDMPETWGATRHRYWYTGHVHHQVVKEFPGVVCESFRTLAARDAYAAGHGYRAGRDMLCIVHHREHGEVERHRCDLGMIEGA